MENTDIVLGVDIGGTTTSFAFVGRDGFCQEETELPTLRGEPASSLVERICVLARKRFALLSGSHRLRGIGIGAPDADHNTGIVVNPMNLSWGTKVNLVELFRHHFELPVSITNDANAAAIGEMFFGAAQRMRHFVVVTLGTGVGSGIVINGEILYGADGFAGEIGHTVIEPDGRQCACGKRGCLEAYASASGLCRTVFTLLSESDEESVLRTISYDQLTARRVQQAAAEGDPVALAAFEATGRVLGMKLADLVALISPEAIFLLGGLAAAGELIFSPTQKSLESHLLGIYRGRVKLLPSGVRGGSAGIVGAGALIWQQLDPG